MKAYRVYDPDEYYGAQTIVFAETRNKAKVLALRTDACEDSRYIDIRVNRYPQADCLYNGNFQIDWYDEDTRFFLVRECGWRCTEPSDLCAGCSSRRYCGWQEDI